MNTSSPETAACPLNRLQFRILLQTPFQNPPIDLNRFTPARSASILSPPEPLNSCPQDTADQAGQCLTR